MSNNDYSEPGAQPYRYWVVQDEDSKIVDGGLIEESLVTIYVNGQELVTIMCSPLDQEALALGFLYNESVIDSIREVRLIKANVKGTAVDVYLNRAEFELPRRMILTSGCGGGITLQTLIDSWPALDSDMSTTPAVVFRRMMDLHSAAKLYNQVRGVHTSILGDEHELLICAEDVGRHNTIDKIAGLALKAGITTQNCILVSSGRISSEMLSKARRMNVTVVASRTAPTSTAVYLAEKWNICIAGYVRRNRMQVYTHPERLGLA